MYEILVSQSSIKSRQREEILWMLDFVGHVSTFQLNPSFFPQNEYTGSHSVTSKAKKGKVEYVVFLCQVSKIFYININSCNSIVL